MTSLSFPEPGPAAAASLLERLPAAMEALRGRLFERYRPSFLQRPADLHDALETAEAVAWCTPFPHLFLPALAEQQVALLAPANPPVARAA